MQHTKRNTEPLQSILRGEISAVETYNQVLERAGDHSRMEDQLRNLREDHEDAIELLKRYVESEGVRPQDDSGPWGIWAKTVTGAAKIMGEDASLKALKEGEEHGLKEYEDLLIDSDIDEDVRDIVRTHLIPNQRTHIAVIDRLMLH